MNKLIYDGECGICTALARWALKKSNGGFVIEPYQTTDLWAISLSYEQAEKSAAFVNGSSMKVYRNARSIFETMKYLGFPFNIMAFFLANPVASSLAYPIYRLVANNRRWISIKLGYNACKI